MTSDGTTFSGLVLLPILFGLFGFVEPCSIGSTLIVIKHLEGQSAGKKLAQLIVFAATRAIFIGLLGMLAVVIGAAFLTLQKSAWIILGAIYVLLGSLYLTNSSAPLMRSVGPSLARLSGLQGSASLGVLFGLNIPACAAPLLIALLSAAAAGGAAGATLASGFVALSVFGFALSLPLVIAVLFEPARRALDWLADLSRRLPFWTGALLVALGLWSIWFGLFARVIA
jgi:cytochrome c-type biogenesis protein